jgi:hypothetical protein
VPLRVLHVAQLTSYLMTASKQSRSFLLELLIAGAGGLLGGSGVFFGLLGVGVYL